MRPRYRWRAYRAKRAVPKDGIKLKKGATTWWGKRWVEALERLASGYSSRLARGKTYARSGRTHDLAIKNNTVTAKVTGSRSRPYKVTIELKVLSAKVWRQAIAAMAQKAQFAAELLGGQMPQEIDSAFEAAGASIFPTSESDIDTDCNCPDWANPCKHIAAVHLVLGQALDGDPFLLFELRGRTKAQVLDELRTARGGKAASPTRRAAQTRGVAQVPTMPFGCITTIEYDSLRQPLPNLQLTFEEPNASGGVLQQLGEPAGWSRKSSPAEMLGPIIRAAAARGRNLALAEPATPTEATDGTADSPADRDGDSAGGPGVDTDTGRKPRKATRSRAKAATEKPTAAKKRSPRKRR